MEALWKFVAPISAALTLATWLFFAYSRVTTSSDPLSVPQTLFVFAFWFATVAAAHSVWKALRKPSKGGGP